MCYLGLQSLVFCAKRRAKRTTSATSVLREAPSEASYPPWPPRPLADMRYFQWQKIIEGIIFRGLDTSHILPFEIATSIRTPRPFKASTSNSISEPLERHSVSREAPSEASHPPWPQRLSADMRYFRCQKIIEGSIFRGLDTSYNLLSDLRSFEAATSIRDLRGQPRPSEAKNCKNRKFTQFEG